MTAVLTAAPELPGLYDPSKEFSACGVGVVADIYGRPSRRVVRYGGQQLDAFVHRGAVAADGRTGDGAGAMLDIDDIFFNYRLKKEQGIELGSRFAVGTFFLPGAEGDPNANALARRIVEETLADARFGLNPVSGWRAVPGDDNAIGSIARSNKPEIGQIFLEPLEDEDDFAFESRLYECRQEMIRRAKEAGVDLYIPSLSRERTVYKGRFRSDQVFGYYNDLQDFKLSDQGLTDAEVLALVAADEALSYALNYIFQKYTGAPAASAEEAILLCQQVVADLEGVGERYISFQEAVETMLSYKSSKVVDHSRFSTNTESTWKGAHPYALAHNGEINTIKSNVLSWLSYMQEKYGNKDFSFVPGLADSGDLSAAMEELIYQGWDAHEALLFLIPPAWQHDPELADDIKLLLENLALEMPPWDGPALVANGAISIHADRSGLRPFRYTVTKDGLFIGGSEEGTVAIPVETILMRGRVGAGEGIHIDQRQGRIFTDAEKLKEMAARDLPTFKATILDISEDYSGFAPTYSKEERIKRQIANGWHSEILEKIVEPMAEDSKEAVGSMGDDTPPPLLSRLFWDISYYFKQRFAQVTNPPIDPIREEASFSLISYLGASPAVQADTTMVRLESPILRPGQLEEIEEKLPSRPIACVFNAADGEQGLRDAIANICLAAEMAVRHDGITNLVLTDRHISDTDAALPMVLAVAAINQHLIDKGLRLKASITVESGQVYQPHQAALMLGFGAAAVDPHILYGQAGTPERVSHVVKAFDAGLKKIMSKMGVCDVRSYIGGKLFESLGLDMQDPLFAWAFQGIASPVRGHGVEEIAENYQKFHKLSRKSDGTELFELGKFASVNNKREASEAHGFSREVVNQLFQRAMNTPHKQAFADAFLAQCQEWIGRVDDDETRSALEETWKALSKQRQPVLKQFEHFLFVDVMEAFSPHAQDALLSEINFMALGFGERMAEIEAGRDGAQHLRELIGEKRPAYTKEYIDNHKITAAYREFSEGVEKARRENPITLMDCMRLKSDRAPIALSEVQAISEIVKHLQTGAMSDGSLQEEVHKTIAQAMNRIHGKSNSGEGGMNPNRAGTLSRNNIVQIASGRFGLTAAYLASADEFEIKIAQGAKPGEGGQLPGYKVTIHVASQRGAAPGIDLISPSNNHDLYSIEDLGNLCDLLRGLGKKAGVKIVSSDGVGTIGIGIAKALAAAGIFEDGKAGYVNMAGNSGGTGAANLSSIYHAGMPSEFGLAELHQGLLINDMDELIDLVVSGGIKNGYDIVKLAAMGAIRFEIGTSALVQLGCIMARRCHIAGEKGCPAGLTTMADERFKGDARLLELYGMNIAAEIQEILASLGYRSLEEIRGHTEVLEFNPPEWVRGQVDVSKPLWRPRHPENLSVEERLEKHKAFTRKPRLDDEILAMQEVQDVLNGLRERVVIDGLELTNADRSFGAKIAIAIEEARLRGVHIASDAFTIRTHGVAGQFYGAFCTDGLHLSHTGVVQDYVGMCQSGGCIDVLAEPGLANPEKQVIAGNGCGYGASGGRQNYQGGLGDRAFVRNSDTVAVIGSAANFLAEYATRGMVVVLDENGVGKFAGAGAAAGLIIQYDPQGKLPRKADGKSVNVYRLTDYDAVLEDGAFAGNFFEETLLELVFDYAGKSNDPNAIAMLHNWENARGAFSIAVPKGWESVRSREHLEQILEAFDPERMSHAMKSAVLAKNDEIARAERTLH